MTLIHSTSHCGKHHLSYEDGSHQYTLDGLPAYGPSTFLKDSLPTPEHILAWNGKVSALEAISLVDSGIPRSKKDKEAVAKLAATKPLKLKEEGGRVGKVLHKFIEIYENDSSTDAEVYLWQYEKSEDWAKIQNCVDLWLSWREKQKNLTVIAAETLVASPRLQAAGTFDRLDEQDGLLILRDWKTSKSISFDQIAQAVFYAMALEEWKGLVCDAVEIISCPKEGKKVLTLRLYRSDAMWETIEELVKTCRQLYGLLKTVKNDSRFKSWADFKKKEKKGVSTGTQTSPELGQLDGHRREESSFEPENRESV